MYLKGEAFDVISIFRKRTMRKGHAMNKENDRPDRFAHGTGGEDANDSTDSLPRTALSGLSAYEDSSICNHLGEAVGEAVASFQLRFNEQH